MGRKRERTFNEVEWVTRSLNPDRPVSEAPRAVPHDIRLDKGRIVYTWAEVEACDDGGGVGAANERRSDGKILLHFIRLADKKEAELVLKFARKYGVLELCEHGEPHRHLVRTDGKVCTPLGEEPLERWFWYARRAMAIARLAIDFRYGSKGRKEDWRVLSPNLAPTASVDERRYGLVALVGKWLRDASVYPQIYWQSGAKTASLRLSGNSVLAAVALQLAYEVTRLDGLLTCDVCGVPYNPEQYRPKNRTKLCSDRCRAERQRQRSRDSMRKKRARSSEAK